MTETPEEELLRVGSCDGLSSPQHDDVSKWRKRLQLSDVCSTFVLFVLLIPLFVFPVCLRLLSNLHKFADNLN